MQREASRTGDARKVDASVEKARVEVRALAKRGVLLSGNAFSSVLSAKGELNAEEKAGAALLSCADGQALRASLAALGYAPEDWAALATCANGAPLDEATLRLAVATLDPATVVLCDEAAADDFRAAYAEDLAALEGFDEAMLAPGVVAHVCGMRVMNLGGFEAALGDSHQKQVMWARLKKLPPLGEPY